MRTWVLMGALAGCGAGGSATVNGTLQGQPMVAVDAVSGVAPNASAIVFITSFGGACDVAASGHASANTRSLSITLTSTVAAAPTVGEYVLGGGSLSADATALTFDASCAPHGTFATSGGVTITAAANRAYSGKFDLYFGTDHLTGSFQTASCPALSAVSNGNITCN